LTKLIFNLNASFPSTFTLNFLDVRHTNHLTAPNRCTCKLQRVKYQRTQDYLQMLLLYLLTTQITKLLLECLL
jgi:hypothetical protein